MMAGKQTDSPDLRRLKVTLLLKSKKAKANGTSCFTWSTHSPDPPLERNGKSRMRFPLRVDQYLHTTANASIRSYQFVLEESFVAFLISGVQLVGRNGVDVYGEYSSRAQMTAVS